ncbi:PadR family transcriptional regulator [Gemmatimonadota bacterium]
MPEKYSDNNPRHLGEFEIVVMLAILRLGQDAYGVTIREELEREISRTLTLGTIYKSLGRLEAKGYLHTRTSEPTAVRGGRRKKLYHVSVVGLRAVNRSLADLWHLTRGLDLEWETS